MIRYAETRAFAAAVSVVLIGACGVLAWDRKMSPELSHTFLIGLLLVPVWALLWIRSSTVRAFGGVVSALAPDRLVRDGLLLGLIALASISGVRNIDAPFAMAMTLAGSATGLGLVSLAMRHWRPRTADHASPEHERRIWRQTALPLVLIAVAETALNRTGVVLLGWAGHTREAGIYAVAFNIAFLVMLPRMAVNAMFAPMTSDLYVRKDHAALQGLVGKASLWTLVGATSIALPLSLFAGTLLHWFGRDFTGGAAALHLLLLGQVVAAGAGSPMFLMTMTGHERAAAVLLISCTVGNAVFTAVLSGPLGLAGAAASTAATLILANLGMALFIWRKLRLVPGVLAAFQSPLRAEGGQSRPRYGAVQ